jgi:hypothetical protein
VYTTDENLNDIEEAALAYKSRGNVFARSCASYFTTEITSQPDGRNQTDVR